MTAMRLKRYPSAGGGISLGKMGVGAKMMWTGYTARDYVQNGLIAMWDGIENAGWGVHDPNATVWKDLSGKGNDFTIEHGVFTSDALDSEVNSMNDNVQACAVESAEIQTALRNNILTVEIVSQTLAMNNRRGLFGLTSKTSFITSAGMYYVSISGFPGWICWRGSYRLNVQNFSTKRTTSFVFSGTTSEFYTDGLYKAKNTSGTGSNSVGSFGLNTVGTNGGKGRIIYNSVRLYSRAITAEEIAANYAVDTARFNLPDAA